MFTTDFEVVRPLADDPDATLASQIVAGMCMVGASVGLALPELLALANLSPASLSDPDARVRVGNAAAVLRRLEEALPGESLALRLLALSPPSAFGLVDLASQHVDTVGEAMDIYHRYARLTSSHVHAWMERGEGWVALRLRHQKALEALRHPVEVGIGHGHRVLMRCGVPPEEVLEIHLRHLPVGDPAVYEAHFGCPVHFASVANAIVLRPETLERPLHRPDPVLARSVVAQLEREMAEEEGPLGALRQAVATHARPAEYSASGIAKRMGRSLRSLQRDASTAGTTLTQLIDDVRMARARELLLDDGLSVDEVGFVVGYSERSAFDRAFKRVFGQTPAEFRRGGAMG